MHDRANKRRTWKEDSYRLSFVIVRVRVVFRKTGGGDDQSSSECIHHLHDGI